jgi:hypothetical protein
VETTRRNKSKIQAGKVVDVEIHIFLTSALAGGERSASRPNRFTPGERTPSTHWIVGWVDARAGLDHVEKIVALTRTRSPTPQSRIINEIFREKTEIENTTELQETIKMVLPGKKNA